MTKTPTNYLMIWKSTDFSLSLPVSLSVSETLQSVSRIAENHIDDTIQS